jgi:hypothetical protein
VTGKKFFHLRIDKVCWLVNFSRLAEHADAMTDFADKILRVVYAAHAYYAEPQAAGKGGLARQ